MRKPHYSALDGQATPLEGFDVFASAGQDNTPRIAAQPHSKLSIVLGVCCRCNDRPAVLKSPSEKYIYCAECGRSRCGVHTVADFEREESSGLWLDPCCVKSDLRQQSLVDVHPFV